MHKITIGKKQILAAENALLSDVLMESGEHVEHPCGRNGTLLQGDCFLLTVEGVFQRDML